jgi:hypothetical protein
MMNLKLQNCKTQLRIIILIQMNLQQIQVITKTTSDTTAPESFEEYSVIVMIQSQYITNEYDTN